MRDVPPNGPPSKLDRLTVLVLRAGVAIPLIYYGLQLLVAPFYPGYNFVTQVASELGSDLSPGAATFNAGIRILGALTLATALAYLRALLRLGARPSWTWIAPAAILVSGVQSFWAAAYPMPDPRHGGHPIFVASMLAMPFLIAASLWRSGGRPLKALFVASMLVILAMAPVMTGKTGLDVRAVSGLAQRVLTLPIFVPIGVGAYCLAKRLEALLEWLQRRPLSPIQG